MGARMTHFMKRWGSRKGKSGYGELENVSDSTLPSLPTTDRKPPVISQTDFDDGLARFEARMKKRTDVVNNMFQGQADRRSSSQSESKDTALLADGRRSFQIERGYTTTVGSKSETLSSSGYGRMDKLCTNLALGRSNPFPYERRWLNLPDNPRWSCSSYS
ncbi:hypothetical protein K461DRAFT_96874 [Myriangium duriaei CBS 260.36]|uniref:Uncharacterized protein n=1 Tax=Myriangium duriaei CBS 260.36 TaxID=1168546 RepID=A0A9P4J7W2_9PEZI|nr:hypothetical protein K461DRAFT_96874 [Myriangium duriaei CBS 260.36]